MRNLFYSAIIFSIIVFLSSCDNKKANSFTVKLDLAGVENNWLFMQSNEQGEWIKIDSTELLEGKASFTGTIEEPLMYYFTLKNTRTYIPVFVEQGTITVEATAETLRDPKVEGSKSNDVYRSFMTSLAAYDENARALGMQYRDAQAGNDTIQMESISKAYEAMEEDKAISIKDFALANNSSVVAPFIMVNYSYMFELDDLESVSENLDPSIATSPYTVSLNDRVEVLQSVEIGQPYIDFTLNDPEGNPIPLSSIANGKYVLVDFWASWCSPCRAENPNVVLAYNTFHDKGFEVFGVSFDREHDKWVEAIEKDGLTWSHVSDLKFWQCEAGKLYGVQSIPHSVLLDPDGIIIAKNLRGEDLQNKLAELLN